MFTLDDQEKTYSFFALPYKTLAHQQLQRCYNGFNRRPLQTAFLFRAMHVNCGTARSYDFGLHHPTNTISLQICAFEKVRFFKNMQSRPKTPAQRFFNSFPTKKQSSGGSFFYKKIPTF